MYNKLFSKIVNSSVWLAPTEHRIVWITFLALMDQDGFVSMASVPNLAHTARVTVDEAQAAVSAFESMDPYAPDQEWEGRRIERVASGWMVLNALRYQALATGEKIREQTRIRNQAYRERVRTKTHSDASVTHRDATVTPSVSVSVSVSESLSEESKSATADKRPRREPAIQDPWFLKFKASYPMRAGSQPWPPAYGAIKARLREGHTWTEIIDGVQRYAEFCLHTGKLRTEKVQQAVRFCGIQKGFLETWDLPASKADVRLNNNLSAADEFMRRTGTA